ncbi:ArnT family glycosyltransferase [Nocardia sp. CA-128927]|uniref:ArnT family glycosyltransferase n=1 Tax=Nocardia sp. CA-128927 TaxID=3239975 RepID=UPI003D9554ED
MTETATVPPRHLDTRPVRGDDPPPRDSHRQWIGLALLLVGTTGAYLWNLSANGWANTYYAAAVEAGATSWKAFFFGSLDASNAITVDKTPASFWPMEISARIFGMNSWSMLVPQVLLGVGSVVLLWAIVRRHYGANAGLLAGLLLALTPVAALMFRFNNPDALLVLLMLAAVWAMSRALDDGRWRWLALCGMFVGFGFLAKQLQVLLVLPALALTYLLFGPPRLGKRIAQLFAAGAAMVAGAGWWILIAQLWPADSRPYFGGSQHNSIIELTLGYNGLDRLTGGEGPGGMGGGRGAMPDIPGDMPSMPGGFGGGPFGQSGIGRMFNASAGGQIAWLIPAALILLVAGIVVCGRARRSDPRRAALVMFGLWGVVTAIVFSLMSGIFHDYYTIALAPALAGTIAAGLGLLWPHRNRWWIRLTLIASVVATAVTAWILLDRTPEFVPWLKWVIAAVAILAALGFSVASRGKLAVVTALAALFVGIAGPSAYTVDTIATAHTGPIPTAGPQTGRAGAGFGGAPGGGPGNGPTTPTSGFPGGGPTGGGAPDPGGATPSGAQAPGARGTDQPAMPGMGNSKVSDKVVALLDADHDSFRWVGATVGAMSQGGYQLASEGQVMAIGGFSGGDPSPTLAQFQKYVAEGDIHYFIAGESGGGMRGSGTNEGAKITSWVSEHYTATEVDGVTLYDLTQPKN